MLNTKIFVKKVIFSLTFQINKLLIYIEGNHYKLPMNKIKVKKIY